MSSSTRIAREVLDSHWSINVAGRVYGPYTGKEISAFVKEGRVAPHSIVRAGEEGPWITAIDDPFLVQLFVVETPRKLPQQAVATEAGASVAATQPADASTQADVQTETNFVIVVEVRAGSPGPIALDSAIKALGQSYRLTHYAWILRSNRTAGAVPIAFLSPIRATARRRGSIWRQMPRARSARSGREKPEAPEALSSDDRVAPAGLGSSPQPAGVAASWT
jgi:hypothetical protein